MKKILNELVTIGTTVKFGTNPSDDGAHDELNAAFANLRAAVSSAKGAADELADVNDLARQVLEDELKGLGTNGGDEARINELRDILRR